MKSNVLILCILSLLPIGALTSNIFLPLDVFEASNLSEELDKNIFVYYYEDDCIFCDLADDSLFIDSEIRKVLSDQYISVKANYRNSIYATWYDKYNVTCLPTMQIISPDGDLVYEIKGIVSIDSFLHVLSSNNQIKRAEVVLDSTENLEEDNRSVMDTTSAEVSIVNAEDETLSLEDEYFTVQLGAFRQFDNAINYRRKLERDFGIAISIFESDQEGLFRLFHGNYQDRSDAGSFIEEMRTAKIEYWYREVSPDLKYFELSVQ